MSTFFITRPKAYWVYFSCTSLSGVWPIFYPASVNETYAHAHEVKMSVKLISDQGCHQSRFGRHTCLFLFCKLNTSSNRPISILQLVINTRIFFKQKLLSKCKVVGAIGFIAPFMFISRYHYSYLMFFIFVYLHIVY